MRIAHWRAGRATSCRHQSAETDEGHCSPGSRVEGAQHPRQSSMLVWIAIGAGQAGAPRATSGWLLSAW
jgi:hypothetical protein